MPTEVYTLADKAISLEAAADLSSNQYRVVLADGNLAGTAGTGGIGILDDKPNAAGRVGRVIVGGVAKALAGAAISVGAILTNDTDGKVVTAVGGDIVIGTALTAAGNADELISMLVVPGGAEVPSA